MNCQNCKEIIPATFVAAIKDNKCPACGQPCLTEKEHGEIVTVVDNIASVSGEISHDTVVKLAVVLHGKFDIFPKGVVVDNVVEKEIVYVPMAVTQPTYANPTAINYQHAQYVPVMAPAANPPLKPHLRQAQAAPLRSDQMSRYQQMIAEFENADQEDENGDEPIVTTMSKEEIEFQEAARTRQLMAEHRANLTRRN